MFYLQHFNRAAEARIRLEESKRLRAIERKEAEAARKKKRPSAAGASGEDKMEEDDEEEEDMRETHLA